jgi:hypothetical protein
MAIKLKIQKDFLLTEGSAEIPTDLNEWDIEMRKTKATGKIVAVYSNGGLVGVNVENKTRATEEQSAKMRKIVKVSDSNL